MSDIIKTTFTFTVLHHDNELLSDDLREVLDEADTGNIIGMLTDRFTWSVPDSAVREELLKLGNDGTFFETDD